MAQVLEGMRVLDLSSYIAGSMTTTLLADLGANVIKIESFEGDGFRPNAASFVGWNPGKRSIVVDNTTDEGREITYTIAARSDLFTENSRPGVTERLKLTYEDIRQVNPNIVYGRVLAYGSTGPSFSEPGFDPLIQARRGMMATQGGQSKPPVFLPAPLLGEHTVEVLRELGYSQSKVDELLERKIVGQQGTNVAVR